MVVHGHRQHFLGVGLANDVFVQVRVYLGVERDYGPAIEMQVTSRVVMFPHLLRRRGRLLGKGQFHRLGSRFRLFVQPLLGVRLRQDHKKVMALLTFNEACRRCRIEIKAQ